MTVRYVAARYVVVPVIGLVSIVSGCTAAPSPNQAGPQPADCTDWITGSMHTSVALALVQPGARVCLSGGLHDAELEVTTSGTPEQPITIVANGAAIRSMDVRADYVVIQGLTLRDGDGLTMAGRGLVARDNVIYNAAENGLACLECVDTLIESNTVQRADGTGIYLAGAQITVRNNTVSESVLRTQGDADGIRFFGVGHRLTGNTIKDIKAGGYDRGGPHTDCFQTYNNASDPPTYDIVIADNECTNVDVQCLIATAKEGGARSTPEGLTAIVFERNTCSVNGSQAVLLENFSRIIVRDNHFSGAGSRAVQLGMGSTDCSVIGNTMTGSMRPFEIDRPSRPGFRAADNTSR
ncbi:MAG: right-handed parallel beta-helix repeat-containing protein [Actinomycetota bacterium]|nr:right-handed parallel beta-helix repeat-containing protein [Actinomycetota bacterium]